MPVKVFSAECTQVRESMSVFYEKYFHIQSKVTKKTMIDGISALKPYFPFVWWLLISLMGSLNEAYHFNLTQSSSFQPVLCFFICICSILMSIKTGLAQRSLAIHGFSNLVEYLSLIQLVMPGKERGLMAQNMATQVREAMRKAICLMISTIQKYAWLIIGAQ